MSNVFKFPAPGICKKNVLRASSEKIHCVAFFLQVSVILERNHPGVPKELMGYHTIAKIRLATMFPSPVTKGKHPCNIKMYAAFDK